MEFTIDKNKLTIDGTSFPFRSHEELNDSRYSLYLYVESGADDTLYAKFGEAKKNTVLARYSQTGHTANNRMTHLWESQKGDKEIHSVLKTIPKEAGFTWAGHRDDNELNTEEAYIIESLNGFNNLVKRISELAEAKPISRKSREPYNDISCLVDEILEKHKSAEKFNLDLCTRWGKTSTMLEILKKSDYRICLMCSYIKTVKTSYKNDIDTFDRYKDFVFIDPDDYRDDPDNCMKDCLNILSDPSKKIMYYIAITGDFKEEKDDEVFSVDDDDSMSTFNRRTTGINKFKNFPSMMVVEEADFGAHCEKQVNKLRSVYKVTHSKLFISTTGTNSEKAECIFNSDRYIKRDYMLDVLKSEYRPNKVGIEWNMLNNFGMVKYFGYSRLEMENFSDMTDVIDGHMKNEEWFRQVISYLYKVNRVNSKDTRTLDKANLIDLEAATMIFTPYGYDKHKAMKKLIEQIFGGQAVVQVIDGLETTNEKAEDRAKEAIKYSNGKPVFFIASGMANRSFSVPEIKNIILFIDGGSYSSIAQKIARGFTPWNKEHTMNHIIDFRLNVSEDFCLRSYLSGLGQNTLEGATSSKSASELIEEINSTDKLLFNEYFCEGENPIRRLSDEELNLIMRDTDFRKKQLYMVYTDIQDKLGVPSICGINEKESKLKDVFNTNIKGDRSRKLKSNRTNGRAESSEEEKKRKEEVNKKEQHFLFLVNNFNLYFNTYKYDKDVLENEFNSMSERRKELLSKTFEIDMDFMSDLVKVLVKHGAAEYFDECSK